MLFEIVFVCACLVWIATCDPSGSSSGNLIILSASSITGSITGSSEASVPTGSYVSYSSTVTISTALGVLGSIGNVDTSMGIGNASSPTTTDIISSSSQILLQGSVTTVQNMTGSVSATATSTSTSVQPTNTTPCNNYPEFCSRQYSNITEVSAHNSPL